MILIVDDDESMSETCSMFLEAQGFDVAVAGSGADALEQMSHTRHELVISDCAMPGMSGVQLSERVRANPATANVPILLMSASMRREAAPGSTHDGFLRKPFLAEALLMEVRKLLADVAAGSTRHQKA